MTSGFSQIACAPAQRHAHVRAVQVIRRAHAQVVDAILSGPCFSFEMAVEPLELGENRVSNAASRCRRRRADRPPHQPVAGVEWLMARGHEARDAGHGEVFES
jgi:hypothetical protein